MVTRLGVTALSLLLALSIACSGDAPVAPPATPAAAPAGLEIGPIAGLTTRWHPAPPRVVVPRDAALRLRCAVPEGCETVWRDVDDTSREGAVAFADVRFAAAGARSVAVDVVDRGRVVQSYRVPVEVVDIDANMIAFGEPELRVTAFPFSNDGGHSKQDDVPDVSKTSVNEMTMEYFFSRESIAALREAGDGRYVTSVGRTVMVRARVEPEAFMPMMEWRGEDGTAALASFRTVHAVAPGTTRLEVGPDGRGHEVAIETYEVKITSHTSREHGVGIGQPTLFSAVTNPPGYEPYITWLASTRHGTTDVVTGRGAEFEVTFDDVLGPLPEDPETPSLWLGVKADNTVFDFDAKSVVGWYSGIPGGIPTVHALGTIPGASGTINAHVTWLIEQRLGPGISCPILWSQTDVVGGLTPNLAFEHQMPAAGQAIVANCTGDDIVIVAIIHFKYPDGTSVYVLLYYKVKWNGQPTSCP